MAEFVVGGKVTIDASGAEKSVGSIKQQLREAQKELLAVSDQFGSTSKQAIAAAKRVAEFKDQIGDAKALTDAFNPDAKFKAFGAALQGVAGGFAAVQGAQALFGSESEDLAKTLAKVQGAMALTQGLDAIGEAGDSFKNLKKVVVDSFNSIKAAIGSTGIGLLVIAVGALAMNWDKVTAALGKASETQKAYNDTLEDYRKGAEDAIQKVNKVKTSFDLAKSGVISKKEALATYNETLGDSLGKVKTLDEAEKMYAAKAQVYIKVTALKAQANAIFAKAAEESAKALTVSQDDNTSYWDKAKSLAKSALGNLGGGLLDFTNAQIEGTKNAQKEAENRSKSFQKLGEDILKQSEELANKSKINNDFEIKENNKKVEKVKDNTEEILNANKELQKQREQINQEAALNAIKDEDARAKKKLEFDYLNQKKDIEQSKASDYEKFNTLQTLYADYLSKINQLEDDIKNKKTQKKAEDDLRESQDTQLSFEQRYAAITERESLESQIVFANEEQRTAFRKANAQARKDIATEEANAQIAAAQFAADSLASISQLVGQDTAAGKALAIAAATVSTYLSAQKAYESQFKPLAIYDSPIRGAIAAGIAIANGLATVKKIASVQIPGNPSGGGSAGSKPTFATPPLPPQLQTTTLNQGQIQQMGNAAVRSFVLESDVSGNQERIRRLNRAARIS